MSEKNLDRRQFMTRAAAGGAAIGLMGGPGWAAEGSGGGEVRVAIMGGGTRGPKLARNFLRAKNARITHVCEVDAKRLDKLAGVVEKNADSSHPRPKKATDIRRVLDDDAVDAIVIAAPDHWHAPATLMACEAGKHVYVEKPASHNPAEGEMMIEAAAKHGRVVQLGTQRRSYPEVIEAIDKLHNHAIGRVYYARAWYARNRGSIGHGKRADPPADLDYELWQGPAPRKPFHTNYLHYTWHWFWNWGTGEAGNNGVHSLDLARWGLDVDYPTRVAAFGGKYVYDDDQQTPDLNVISYDFKGEKSAVWEGLSRSAEGINDTGFGVTFYGTEGSLYIHRGGYETYDRDGKSTGRVEGSRDTLPHIVNFLDAVRHEDPSRLNAPIETGHKSTLLSHLANISHRTNRLIHCDPDNKGRIIGDDEAMQYWSRDYAPGWKPRV